MSDEPLIKTICACCVFLMMAGLFAIALHEMYKKN